MITEIKDDRCVIGTFDSLLSDCNGTDEQKKKIKDFLLSRTEGIGTNLHPTLVPEMLKEIFNDVKVDKLTSVKDFEKIQAIDNKDSFGILFWDGDGESQNHHCTRFVNVDVENERITLMEPGMGQIVPFDLSKLNDKIKNGFTYVSLANKAPEVKAK